VNTAVIKTRTPPTIIPFGKREVISTGQFNAPLVAEKIIRDGVNEWVSVSEVARFVYGRSFKTNNDRIRRCIWNLRRELLRRGFLLITEGRPVEYVKIFVSGSGLEKQIAEKLLLAMYRRRDFSKELYDRAASIVA
jgi:hypothetical protein